MSHNANHPSDYLDPTSWRGRTTGNIPFRLVDSVGTFESELAVVTETYLVQTSKLLDFYLEVFPPPDISIWGIPIYNNKRLPGTQLRARRMIYKGHVPGKPIDPFNQDPNAVNGTYHHVVEVQIEYDNEKETVDPGKPETFVTIRGSAAGEFINAGTSSGSWIPPGGGTPDPNLELGVGTTMIVPEIQWDLIWEQMPRKYFADYFIHRLRDLEGKVNSDVFTLLFDAAPETLLFVGFDFEEARTRFVVRPEHFEIGPDDPSIFEQHLRVSMKFLEKRITNEDVASGSADAIFGHNHIWKPDEGWRRLLIDGTNPLYRSASFMDLFASINENEEEEA